MGALIHIEFMHKYSPFPFKYVQAEKEETNLNKTEKRK